LIFWLSLIVDGDVVDGVVFGVLSPVSVGVSGQCSLCVTKDSHLESLLKWSWIASPGDEPPLIQVSGVLLGVAGTLRIDHLSALKLWLLILTLTTCDEHTTTKGANARKIYTYTIPNGRLPSVKSSCMPRKIFTWPHPIHEIFRSMLFGLCR
jgi:hypothetical protein